LDKRGEILRYRAAGNGYGSKQGWLASGVEPDFSKVVSMAIDGSIWVLTSSGKIEKYSQGTGVAVEIKGIDVPLAEPTAIYTDGELESAYVLDKGNKRVVEIDKEGEYRAQYRFEGIVDATDMVVAKEEGKILLLVESKIYQLELQN